jgi:hypothetical protein
MSKWSAALLEPARTFCAIWIQKGFHLIVDGFRWVASYVSRP